MITIGHMSIAGIIVSELTTRTITSGRMFGSLYTQRSLFHVEYCICNIMN